MEIFQPTMTSTLNTLALLKMKPWQWNFPSPSFKSAKQQTDNFVANHTFSAISKSTIMYFCFVCKEPSRYNLMMLITNKENFRCKPTNIDITRCLDSYYTTLYTSKHHYRNMSWKGYSIHNYKKTCTYFEDTYSLQCHFIKFPPTPEISGFKLGH